MISFLITVKDEEEYITQLLEQLETTAGVDDEIVIVSDFSDYPTLSILENFRDDNSDLSIEIYSHHLNGDFAAHKNFGIEQCTKPWIFQIDADELMSLGLANNVHTLLEYNEDVDLFLVPRVNIVEGLTQEDIQRWGWRVNEHGWVMWPDFQTRIFQNNEDIRWHGAVHERIVGFTTYSMLPEEEDWALYHLKDIDRQREQNALYETIQRT